MNGSNARPSEDTPTLTVPIKGGEFALIDAKDEKNIRGYKWGWCREKGVVAHEKKQKILMHNLIAPYRGVSFVNGDKRDCRRSNLTRFVRTGRKSVGNPKGKNNVFNDVTQSRLQIHRGVVEAGQKYIYRTAFRYTKNRSFDEAMTLALQQAEVLRSLTREEFIKFVTSTRHRPSMHDALLTFDAFQGGSLCKAEYWQSGIVTKPNN